MLGTAALLRSTRPIFVRYRSFPKKTKTKYSKKHDRDFPDRNTAPENPQKARNATQKIISESQSSDYYDPENTTLDFSLSNARLCNQIASQTKTRMEKRFGSMSEAWQASFKKLCDEELDVDALLATKGADNATKVKNEIKKCFQNASITAERANSPISVGDLVVLRTGSSKLYIIVAVPQSLNSSSYTFLDSQGRIVFGSKTLIKLRLPKVTPDHLDPVLEKLVILERKHYNLAPVGVVDDKFSRSSESLPEEIRNKSKIEVKKNDDSIPIQEDDLIVAQTSGQLLTNTNVNTFMVPEVAREVYSAHLSKLSLDAFDKFKVLVDKLEALHRVLQHDENGDVSDSPRSISLFQIMDLLESLPLESAKKLTHEQLVAYAAQVTDLVGDPNKVTQQASLGKLIAAPESQIGQAELKEYSLSTYFAVLLALRKQGRLWKVNQPTLAYPPKSVTLLPIRHSQSIQHLMFYCQTSNGTNAYSEYIVSQLKGQNKAAEPSYYQILIGLFKDYVSGNVVHDLELETLIVSILRKVDSQVTLNDATELPTEYGRSACYLLLQKLGVFDHSGFDNPAMWSTDLQMPITSIKSSLDQHYYDCLDEGYESKNLRSSDNKVFEASDLADFDDSLSGTEVSAVDDLYETDPMEAVREDFGETPVYCIDSEDAHEIDDGIAVQETETDYIITIHVANPSSYIKPYSTLSNIAFSRGFTNYFPEGPQMMFPKFVGEVAGLGTTKQTRTFAVQFQVQKHLLAACKADHVPENSALIELHTQIRQSAMVKFFRVTNFAQGFSYNKVNEVLQKRHCLDQQPDIQHYKNLSTLFDISSVLKRIRFAVGNGIGFNLAKSTVNVEYLQNPNAKRTFKINPSGYELVTDGVKIDVTVPDVVQGDSQLLVSEMMIMANHLASLHGDKNSIPLVHRNQTMKLSKQTVDDLKAVDFANARVDEITRVIEILSSAKLDKHPYGHKALGLDYYSQVTSPLRRYSDMVNQWNFQSAALNQDPIDNHIDTIISHLQNREAINKKISTFSNQFWEGVFLREYLKIKNEANNIKFGGILNRHLTSNRFTINASQFTSMRSFLELTDTEKSSSDLQLNTGSKVGNLYIQKIDFIDSELVFTLDSPTGQ